MIALYATVIAAFARAILGNFGILHVRREFALAQIKEANMTRFLHNALGLAVALGTGGLMFAVAFV
jgi:hypothetical protein